MAFFKAQHEQAFVLLFDQVMFTAPAQHRVYWQLQMLCCVMIYNAMPYNIKMPRTMHTSFCAGH